MSIKCMFMDVDGTLTDGKLYIGNHGEVMKAFSVKDGQGINHLHSEYDVLPVILTGRRSRILKHRCKELGIKNLHQKVKKKVNKIKDYEKDYAPESFSYIGDDINDLPAIRYVNSLGGITACPADAADEVKKEVTYICAHNGGDGAVRSFTEFLIDRGLVIAKKK